jgi:hypothetical protein
MVPISFCGEAAKTGCQLSVASRQMLEVSPMAQELTTEN